MVGHPNRSGPVRHGNGAQRDRDATTFQRGAEHVADRQAGFEGEWAS